MPMGRIRPMFQPRKQGGRSLRGAKGDLMWSRKGWQGLAAPRTAARARRGGWREQGGRRERAGARSFLRSQLGFGPGESTNPGWVTLPRPRRHYNRGRGVAAGIMVAPCSCDERERMAETGAEVTTAAAASPPADEKKKRRPFRHKKLGGGMAEQIMKAVALTKERRGLSVAAMKKILTASGYNLERRNSRVNRAVRTLVSRGSLVQTAGCGASGSVRLGGGPLVEPAVRRRRARRLTAPRKRRRTKGRSRRKKAGTSRKAARRWQGSRARRAAGRRRPVKGVEEETKAASDSEKPANLEQQGTAELDKG
ncbi:histone H1-like [Narcine bancroftii]|uniref:histone H1-like n=1 Tax=Narcine bancroftii TaxID=1343680 RepID=UPI003831DDC7